MTLADVIPVARRHAACAVLLVLLGALGLAATWSHELADSGGDSATYLLTARHYAPYLPPDPAARAVAEASQFPPLHPLLLAATGGAADLRLAHATTVICLLAALAFAYAYLLALGLARSAALASVVFLAALPGTLTIALQIRSEAPYLALTLAGFWLLSRGARTGGAREYWAAVAVFAAAALTRSVGIALLAPLVVAVMHRRPRGWYWMPLAMLVPGALWSFVAPDHSYLDVLRYAQLPLSEATDQLLLNARGFAWGVAGNVLKTQPLLGVLVVLGLVAFAVLVARLRRGEPDAWYLAAYGAIMLLWPYPAEGQRFAWVVMPWFIGYAMLGGAALANRLGRVRLAPAVRWAPATAMALLILPSVAIVWQRAVQAPDPALARWPDWYAAETSGARAQAQALVELLRAVARLGPLVPPGECVYSVKPSIIAFYTGRRSVRVPPEHTTATDFERWLARGECRFFVLLSGSTDGVLYPTPLYPRDRLAGRLTLVRVEEGGAALAALAP